MVHDNVDRRLVSRGLASNIGSVESLGNDVDPFRGACDWF
jgi:hypothetical protein